RDLVPELLQVEAALEADEREQEAPRPDIATSSGQSRGGGVAIAGEEARGWRRRLASVMDRQRASRAANEGVLESAARSFSFRYEAQARAAGTLTLPGVRLSFQDRYGFFQLHR